MNGTKRTVVALVLGCLVLTAPLAAAAQGLSATPNPVDFGMVYIGQSTTRAVTITNTGVGDVAVTDLQIWNMWQVPYTMVSPPALPYLLGSGESMTVILRFAPPDFSFWDGKLKIYSDSPTTPYIEVRLTGFGDYPPPNPCFPLTSCSGVCVNTATDVRNCGACGNVCPAPVGGNATCTAGVCGEDCLGLDNCGGVCLDLESDVDNCGACGNVCADPVGGSATCDAGVCGNDCGGLADCGGVCLDLESDVDNCGACGNVCADPVGGSAVCAAGACASDCGALTDCGGVCLDTSADLDNCGACGNVCVAPANGTALCTAGTCDFECDAGYVPDGGACVPEVVDVGEQLDDLMAYFLDAVRNRTIVGRGGPAWARAVHVLVMWRELDRALDEYDRGRMDRACFRLDQAYMRADGMPRPSDYVEGPGTEELLDRILSIMAALGCS